MAHFARVKNNKVTAVIVIEQAVLDSAGGWVDPNTGEFAPKEDWIQTSYNIGEGEYKKGFTQQEKDSLKLSGTADDIKARSRKNYAGVGYTYDTTLDAFIPPQPFDSWKLDKNKCSWNPPKICPIDDNLYNWDEQLLDWVIIK